MNILYKWFFFLFLFFTQFVILAQDSQLKIKLKVLLSASYSDGLMRTDLQTKGLIPNSQPFNHDPWFYYGDENISTVPNSMVDWVFIELRESTNQLSAARAGLLLNTGDVVDLDGTSELTFNGIASGNYFITIQHRNHIGIISKEKYYISTELVAINFTDSSLSVLGENGIKNIGDNLYGLFAGDSDGSGEINVLDYKPIADNIYKLGYSKEDLDLNGVVNVLDYSMVYNNILKKSYIPEIIETEEYFDTVANYTELVEAVNSASDGDEIAVIGDVTIPFGVELLIDKNINVVGIVEPFPKISNSSTKEFYGLIQINNSSVEIRNIDIDGMNYEVQRDGLQFNNSVGTIDNCILQNFSFSPINIYNKSVVTVRNSQIINNDRAGLGYGISVADGANLIAYENYFNNNRHHVAGGDADLAKQPSFTLYNNLFDQSTKYTNYTGTAVDMHGQAHYTKNGNDIYAGKLLKVYNNTFNDPSGVGIGIRGIPQDSLIVHGNHFAHDWMFYNNNSNQIKPAIQQYLDPSVQEVLSETAYGNFYISHNSYSGVIPPYHWDQWETIFQVNYNNTWNRLCPVSNEIQIEDLLFGDFNGDGVTDIISDRNVTEPVSLGGYPEGIDETGKIWVSWGGLTMWKVLNISNISISQLTVADVNNDGASDLIYNNSEYSVSGLSEWQELPEHYSNYPIYDKSDFDGDGTNDEFRISTQ